MPLPLPAWHDYFTLVGTAAATLIGAMFVVVSIGSGFLTRDHTAAVRAFLTSSVAHLSAVLLGAVVTTVPALDRIWFGALVAGGALVGLGYSLHVALGFRQHSNTVRSDWFWYAILPLILYALLLAAAAAALYRAALSLDLFAGALAGLLVAGIRNAWDMIVFLVTRNRSAG